MGYIETDIRAVTPKKTHSDKALMGRNGALKRIMDLVIASTALLFLAPVFIGVALAVKLTSKGNIFYLHPRTGLNGEVFAMYKFRSMHTNGDEILKAHLEKCSKSRAEWNKYQKLQHDPRITRIGRFLRKSSLDELPQLINVLQGTMSIVGQRPLLPVQVETYGAANYADYIRTRPGITGLWQVSGRSTIPFDQRIEMEKEYVRNWSIWLDMKILFKTVPAIVFPKGAF